jgi:hypothetical protein
MMKFLVMQFSSPPYYFIIASVSLLGPDILLRNPFSNIPEEEIGR